ncbi:unnamed protein product [Ectocarpus sp. CCAP 1310/34]|nr:unnamed protein product [Ectocarpus sp. CCAP 1310/34]
MEQATSMDPSTNVWRTACMRMLENHFSLLVCNGGNEKYRK